MRTIIIETKTIETDNRIEIHPVIPFSEFPEGRREANPDKDGNLVWIVYVDEA